MYSKNILSKYNSLHFFLQNYNLNQNTPGKFNFLFISVLLLPFSTIFTFNHLTKQKIEMENPSTKAYLRNQPSSFHPLVEVGGALGRVHHWSSNSNTTSIPRPKLVLQDPSVAQTNWDRFYRNLYGCATYTTRHSDQSIFFRFLFSGFRVSGQTDRDWQSAGNTCACGAGMEEEPFGFRVLVWRDLPPVLRRRW